MTMDVMDVVRTCFVIFITIVPIECRQMCLTCQFQSTVEGYETSNGKDCITAPLNWTGGEIRMKCPSQCTITARFDEDTLVPTFFHRGCQKSDREDGCTKTGLWYDCFYSCGDGENYCNDQTSFEVIQKKIEEKKGKNKDEDEEKDDMAASLYCLVGLIGVCAIGYFLKKKYCSSPEDEEEGGVS